MNGNYGLSVGEVRVVVSDKDFKQVLRQIDELKAMAEEGFFRDEKIDWKIVWDQIRKTGDAFKGVRFQSQTEHQAAWERFQSLIDVLKEKQEAENLQWQELKRRSGEVKKEVIVCARNARPSVRSEDLKLTLATDDGETPISTAFSAFDERRDELKKCRDKLKEGFALLSEHKDDMLGRDKNEAYSALNKAKEELDLAWEVYTRTRQETYERYRTERQQKHDDWVGKVESNIRKLEERRQRLTDIIDHKEKHLDALHEKLNDAWSDDFREKVTGWISDEETSLQDLKRQFEEVACWLQESQERLHHSLKR